MNSIIDSITLFQTTQDLSVFDTAINGLTQDIISLDKKLNDFNNPIQGLQNRVVIQMGGYQNIKYLQDIQIKDYDFQQKMIGTDNTAGSGSTPFFEQVKGYVKTTKSIGNVASEGIELAESFGELPAPLKKVKSTIKGVNGLLDAIGGIEDIAGATNAAETLATGSEILTGAEGAATVASAFGPPGLVVGTALLATAGIAAFVMSEGEKHREPQKQDFLTLGLNEKNQYFVDQQKQSQDINVIAEWSKQKTRVEFDTEVMQIADKMLKQGGDIYFDPSKAFHDATYIPGLLNALNKDSKGQRIKSISFDNKDDKETFTKAYDPYQRYPLQMKRDGLLNISTRDMQIDTDEDLVKKISTDQNRVASLNQYPHFLTEMLNRDLKNKISLYLTNRAYDLQAVFEKQLNEYKNSPVLINGLKENQKSLSRLKELDKEQHSSGNISSRKPSADNQRQITINLNRPMIEHFTITTKDSKEGLQHFKHKVEEVLLEILNNVNVN